MNKDQATEDLPDVFNLFSGGKTAWDQRIGRYYESDRKDRGFERHLRALMKAPERWISDETEVFLRVSAIDSYYNTHLYVHSNHRGIVDRLMNSRRTILAYPTAASLLRVALEGEDASRAFIGSASQIVMSIAAAASNGTGAQSLASKVMGFIFPDAFPLFDSLARDSWAKVIQANSHFTPGFHTKIRRRRGTRNLNYAEGMWFYGHFWERTSEPLRKQFVSYCEGLSQKAGFPVRPLTALDKFFWNGKPDRLSLE